MIKVENNEVSIEGNVGVLCSELTAIVYEMLKSPYTTQVKIALKIAIDAHDSGKALDEYLMDEVERLTHGNLS